MEENAQSLPHRAGQHKVKSTGPLREEVSMLRAENTRLMQERENLIMDLEECKSELFKRIPPDQISDESIGKALERIRGSIDEFVFDTIKEVADDVLYSFCQRKQQEWQQKSQQPRNFLNTLIMMQDIRAWGPYECSNFSILSAIIQRVLDEYVFKSKYPMGITKEQKVVLEEVEKGMWHASGMQKPERLDLWRSDTLRALTTLGQNEPRLERAAEGICNKLNDILSPWLFEVGPFSKVEARFRHEILNPALKLHQDLKSASHQYETRYVKSLDGLSPKQMLDEWVLKDADTWQKVRVERDVGRALYCLHPSIIRVRAESTTPTVVAKPEIVVQGPDKKIFSDSQRHKDSTPPSSKQGNSAQVRVAEKTSTFINSDSSTDSSRKRQPSSQNNITSRPPPRRLSVPVEPSTPHQQEDRSSGHQPHHRKSNVAGDGKRQPVSRKSSRANPPDVTLPPTRGHSTEGSPYPRPSSQGAAAVRQPPPRKSSEHASGRSVGEMRAQPRSTRASSVSGQDPSAIDKSRGLKRFFGRR